MGRLVTNKGLVRMSKGGVSHEFVLESVPVWEAKGWKAEEGTAEAQPNEVAVLLNENAQEQGQDEHPDAAVHEALSNEAKAVTGPSTKNKK